ncbi:hypothetical protein BH11MYX4_BH11MYX4_32410 [soil metagenome]
MISLDPTPGAPSSAAGTPDDRATEFTAVDPNTEQFNGSTLLVEAYAAIWVILMGWLFLLWRKQAGLAVRLDDLERTIDRAAAAAENKAKAGAS